MCAIDGCHIPIVAPELNRRDYYNRNRWYSVIIQAIVDHEYLFLDMCVGLGLEAYMTPEFSLINSR